jgi:predicted patatin/cPLA2 family phospholipase
MTAEIVEILKQRAARGSQPPHEDGFSVALCVEGGSMRGVVSAGMATALDKLGLVQAFDAVYGSSAGAMNAAYFLAGQVEYGTTIYFEDINNDSFISALRPFGGRPIVDLGYLIDDVVTRRKPLNIERVLASRTRLAVLATDAATSERVIFRHFEDRTALLRALRAGATMPIVAGGPFEYRTRRYFDASLSEPIPVPTAEADGHTHVLALLTRPDEEGRTVSALDTLYVIPRLRRISPALASKYVERGEPYLQLLRNIAAGTGPAGRAQVLGIRPDPPPVSKLERRRERLVAGADAGFRAVMTAFA